MHTYHLKVSTNLFVNAQNKKIYLNFYERFHHSAMFLILRFSFSSICCISSCNVPLQGKFRVSIAGQSTHLSSIVGEICLSNFCHELLYLKLYRRKICPQFWKSSISSAIVCFLRMNDSCRSCYSRDRSLTQDVWKINGERKKSDQR